MFDAQHGTNRILYMGGALFVSVLFIALLQLIPQRLRRYVIMTVTFLGGLFFALEFFWPVHNMPTPGDPAATGNFLTPGVKVFGAISPVIQAFAVGLGVINLFSIHGKRLIKGSKGAFNSLVFFVSTFVMLVVTIAAQARPKDSITANLNKLLFDGALQSLDATMFSIIAFYIVSAAYRAFRVRSVEATLLLITAIIVMLGQIPVGVFLTHNFPHLLHVEVIRNWILTKANAAAIRAIEFGLGIGSLAMALRIWLGLERGSYFDSQH